MANASENLDVRIQASVDLGNSAQSVGELRTALRQLQGAAIEAGQENQEAFVRASQAAAQLRGRLDDVNEAIQATDGSPIEAVGNSVSLLSEGIGTLDFDKITNGLNALTANVQGLSFDGLTNGIGGTVKAFGNLAKAVSTNPILILGAAILLIVTNFEKLATVGGVIGKVFSGIGDFIKYAVDLIKEFLDFLQLTNFKGQENADQVVKNNKLETEAITARYDAEIALAQATGQEVDQLQEHKLQRLKEVADADIKVLEELRDKDGLLSKERQESLDAAIKKRTEYTNQLLLLEAQVDRKQRETLVKYEDLNKSLNINLIKDDTKRSIAQIRLDGEQKKSAIEKDIAITKSNLDRVRIAVEQYELFSQAVGAQQTAEQIEFGNKLRARYDVIVKTLKEQQKTIVLNEKDTQSRINEVNAKASTERSNKAKADREKAKSDAKARVESELKTIKAERELIKKEDDVYSAENLKRFKDLAEKEIQLRKDNAKILYDNKITANTDLATANNAVIKEMTDADEKYYANKLELSNRAELAIVAERKISAKTNKEILDAEILDLETQTRIKLQNTKLTAEEEQVILDEANKSKAALNAKFAEDERQKRYNEIEANLDLEKALIESGVNNSLPAKLKLIDEELAYARLKRDEARALEVEAAENNAEKIAEINKRYALQDAVDVKLAEADKTQARKENLDKSLTYAEAFSSAIGSLGNLVSALEKNRLKNGEKMTLEMQKRQFKRQKAIQLAQAVIGGAVAAINGFSQAPFLPVGLAAGIAASVASAAQLVTIASTKFNPDSESTGASTAPIGNLSGSAAGASANAAPQIQAPTFFGIGQQAMANSGAAGAQQVFVLESDISRTQNKVNVLESRNRFP